MSKRKQKSPSKKLFEKALNNKSENFFSSSEISSSDSDDETYVESPAAAKEIAEKLKSWGITTKSSRTAPKEKWFLATEHSTLYSDLVYVKCLHLAALFSKNDEELTSQINQLTSSSVNKESIVALVNLILEGSGFPGNFIAFEEIGEGLPEEVLASAFLQLQTQRIALLPKFPLKSTDRSLISFAKRYSKFWIKLTENFEVIKVAKFHEKINVWLKPLSTFKVRNARFSGCITAYCISMGIISKIITITKDLNTYDQQLKIEQKKETEETLKEYLKKMITACLQDITLLLEILDHFYEDILIPRQTDVCADIRYETYKTQAYWITKYPKKFYSEPEKIISFSNGLYDESERVRLLVAEFIKKILESSYNKTMKTELVPKILPRLFALTSDQEVLIATTTVEILVKLALSKYLHKNQILEVISNLFVYPNMFQASEMDSAMFAYYMSLTEAFGRFMDASRYCFELPSNDSFLEEDEDPVRKLLSIVDFCSQITNCEHQKIDLFITAFVTQAPCLKYYFDLLKNFGTDIPANDFIVYFAFSCMKHISLANEVSFLIEGNENISDSKYESLKITDTILKIPKSSLSSEGILLCVAMISSALINSSEIRNQPLAEIVDKMIEFLKNSENLNLYVHVADVFSLCAFLASKHEIPEILTPVAGCFQDCVNNTIRLYHENSDQKSFELSFFELYVFFVNENIVEARFNELTSIIEQVLNTKVDETPYFKLPSGASSFVTLISLQYLSLAFLHTWLLADEILDQKIEINSIYATPEGSNKRSRTTTDSNDIVKRYHNGHRDSLQNIAANIRRITDLIHKFSRIYISDSNEYIQLSAAYTLSELCLIQNYDVPRLSEDVEDNTSQDLETEFAELQILAMLSDDEYDELFRYYNFALNKMEEAFLVENSLKSPWTVQKQSAFTKKVAHSTTLNHYIHCHINKIVNYQYDEYFVFFRCYVLTKIFSFLATKDLLTSSIPTLIVSQYWFGIEEFDTLINDYVTKRLIVAFDSEYFIFPVLLEIVGLYGRTNAHRDRESHFEKVSKLIAEPFIKYHPDDLQSFLIKLSQINLGINSKQANMFKATLCRPLISFSAFHKEKAYTYFKNIPKAIDDPLLQERLNVMFQKIPFSETK